jgi:HEAT repeat protein
VAKTPTRIWALIWALALPLAGCGKSGPILAGGKPAAYWAKAVHDPDVSLRKKAVVKLGNIGTADETVLPALLEALRDREAIIRKEAILALLKFGPAARQALDTLTDLGRRDPDAEVREYALKAARRLEQT